MTYEEEFEKIILKLEEHRKRTSKDRLTRVTFTDNTFTKLRIQSVISILLQLQDDEKILKVVDAYQELGSFDPYDHPKPDNYDDVDIIIVELNENYDLWYEKYLSDKLSDIEYMEHASVAVIYEALLDLQEAVQLDGGHEVEVRLLSLKHRFPHLLPRDGNYANIYFHSREQAFKYLLRNGVILKLDQYADRQHFDIVKAKLSISKLIEYMSRAEKAYNKAYEDKPADKVVKVGPIWDDSFHWIAKVIYSFGTYGQILFDSEDRAHIFRVLTEKRGYWATMNELQGKNSDDYVRKAISEIRGRLPADAKDHIEIISSKIDDLIEKPTSGSAYRLRITL